MNVLPRYLLIILRLLFLAWCHNEASSFEPGNIHPLSMHPLDDASLDIASLTETMCPDHTLLKKISDFPVPRWEKR